MSSKTFGKSSKTFCNPFSTLFFAKTHAGAILGRGQTLPLHP